MTKNKRIFSKEHRKKLSEAHKRIGAPWNKGKKCSEEHKKKISEFNKGKKLSEETRKRMSESKRGDKNHFYGKKHSEETKEKIGENNARFWLGKKRSEETIKRISEATKGKKHPPFSEEHKRKMSEYRKGHTVYQMTDEIRKRMSEAQEGKPKPWNRRENCHFWKGGITPINKAIRMSIEYRLWREAVFARDNWTCQKTGIRGGIVAHHINNFSQYPELRTSIENGITLSEKAHNEFHKLYGKKNNTKEQVEEFLK